MSKPHRFLFEDNNHPGVVYLGTQQHFEGLFAEGGYPAKVSDIRIRKSGFWGNPQVRYRESDTEPFQWLDPVNAPDHWLRNVACETCDAIVPIDEAVYRQGRDGKPCWHCSQECMGHLWPDAMPAVQPGDCFVSELIAFESPREALLVEQYNRDRCGVGFEYMAFDDHHSPWDLWTVLLVHPDDPELFLLVPWTGAPEQAAAAAIDDRDGEGVQSLPFAGAMTYTAWHCADAPEAQEPRPVWLMLGRGVWRSLRDLDVAARQQRLTEATVKSASSALRRLFAPAPRDSREGRPSSDA